IWPVLFVIIFPLAFGSWGFKMVRDAKRARIIAESGTSGQGRVVSASPTGTRINGVPVMRIDLQATIPGRPPFPASPTQLMPSGQAQSLVGRDLPILWHPNYPNEVVLEI